MVRLPLYVLHSRAWVKWVQTRGSPKELLVGTVNPLQSNYLACPVNVHDVHWILVIVTHPSDLIDPARLGCVRTTVIILDSVESLSRDVEESAKNLLWWLCQAPRGQTGLSKEEVLGLPLYYAPVSTSRPVPVGDAARRSVDAMPKGA